MKNQRLPERAVQTVHESASRDTDEQVLLRLEWTVLRRLDGLLQGDYRTLLRGFGLDFAGLREYQFEDDVRHIDWNVTARMTAPYVRQFSEDRDMNAWFLVDLSPSADFGSHRESKRDVAVRFVATMARLLSRHGNRTGAMLYGSTVDTVIPPGSDRRHVLHLLHGMRHRPVLGAVGPTQLAVLLQRAAATLKRRSAVFIVSDFISEPGWEAPLSHLAQRHDVVAVHMTDPAEQTVPDLGLITMEDPETGDQFFVDTGDPTFRERYVALAAAQATHIQRTCARYGAGFLPLATDQSLLDQLVRFAQTRRRQPQQRQSGKAAA
ncbi:MAG: DUF58 domain-containing protein [Burkholderiales bacterium]|nr:DUF58 domain-containing protein [Burkholderiales bacterium]